MVLGAGLRLVWFGELAGMGGMDLLFCGSGRG